MFLDAEGPEINPPTPGRPDPGVRDHHVFLDAEGQEINPPTPGRPDPGVRAEGPPDNENPRPQPLSFWGYVSGRGVGRQILAKAVRSPKVFQMSVCLSFGDTFLGGASAVRSWPKPSGAQKCSKLMLF